VANQVSIEWNGDDVAHLSQWFFDSGGVVSEGDLLCELTQEKAAVEVRAPVGGVLTILVGKPDSEIPPGTVLAVIAEA